MTEQEQLVVPLSELEASLLLEASKRAGFTSNGLMMLRRLLFERDVLRRQLAECMKSRKAVE